MWWLVFSALLVVVFLLLRERLKWVVFQSNIDQFTANGKASGWPYWKSAALVCNQRKYQSHIFSPVVIMTNCYIYGIEIHQHISQNISLVLRPFAALHLSCTSIAPLWSHHHHHHHHHLSPVYFLHPSICTRLLSKLKSI